MSTPEQLLGFGVSESPPVAAAESPPLASRPSFPSPADLSELSVDADSDAEPVSAAEADLAGGP
jgi:hypothetical protein